MQSRTIFVDSRACLANTKLIFGHLYIIWFCDKNFGPEAGKFLEKGARNHIFVDSCSSVAFSEKNIKRGRKVDKVLSNYETNKNVLGTILSKILHFEESCFFNF